jgi:hypothetical protein
MGNLLIFVILAVTIPRWALTLAQVDTFGVAGIPLAAIGEAVVLEFGNLYILSVFNRCRTYALQYQGEWEALNQRNIEQGKKTRKPPRDARVGGYLVLPAALLILEFLTIVSQTPFIAGQLMSESAVDLLNDWGMPAVWGYALLLVISPGIMTVGIGFGIHYENVLRQVGKTAHVPWYKQAVAFLPWITNVADRPQQPTSDQPTSERPVKRETGQRPSDQPPTERPVADHLESSAGLAAHLNTIKERMQQERFGGRSNSKFQRMSVEDWLGLSKSQAINVINYGLDHGVLEKSGRYEYQFARRNQLVAQP